MVLTTCVFYLLMMNNKDEDEVEDDRILPEGLLVAGIFVLVGLLMAFVGNIAGEHQATRMLRQPPLLGDWATRNFVGVCIATHVLVVMLAVICLARFADRYARLCKSQAGSMSGSSLRDEMTTCMQDFILNYSSAIVGIVGMSIMLAVWTVLIPLSTAQKVAAARASYMVLVALLWERVGDAQRSVALLDEARLELEMAVGVEKSFENARRPKKKSCEDAVLYEGRYKCKLAFRELREAIYAIEQGPSAEDSL